MPNTTGTANGETAMATAQVKHHDYHLVDPSPWPIVGSVSAFIMAVGAITWMHHLYVGGADHFRHRRHRRALHHGELVDGCDPRGAVQGRPHPRGADQPPLRHDPVHRLRGDVLRRLVLGLLQLGAVSRRSRPRHPRRAVRRRVAAQGHRDLRSLASAAAQHAVAADLGHHGDLGAPRAAGERSPGPEIRPDPDHPARRHLHLRAGL